jgi:hypothetical protein
VIVVEFEILSRYVPGGLRKISSNLSEDSRFTNRDLNLGFSDSKSGVITTRPRHPVYRHRDTQIAVSLGFERGHCVTPLLERSRWVPSGRSGLPLGSFFIFTIVGCYVTVRK